MGAGGIVNPDDVPGLKVVGHIRSRPRVVQSGVDATLGILWWTQKVSRWQEKAGANLIPL